MSVDTGLLGRIELFKNLEPSEITEVAKHLKPRQFSKGEVIFKEKAPGDEMFLIEKGSVEVSLARDDVLLVLAELGRYSFFGEMALLTQRVRSATVTALSDCVLYSLKRSDLSRLVEERPALSAKVLLALSQTLCDRIAATNDNLETHFLINRAIVDNEQFRQLYIGAQQTKAPQEEKETKSAKES
ncbi:hypothetical protein AMJ71_09310 [candidate division TA06 bacterium SM1_40]|jgi:CRP-like cAMP-binding protein|uniref:Cyclic nucleotide-binding domain-containing protein n=2 Tax=Bacteria division TA06 TaxID=1156500 RepID=A0A0S8JAK4_UNCT6|nr:MAG: hypothetical protein AMJ82_04075 [candidate division TA06 bacterium SM23_40]KPL06783.1 MAG: hypothetical protein AMJ71_09310 [candidate division TA06 bacterium SM1_40]